VGARGNSPGKVSTSGNAPSKDLTVHNDVSAFVFHIERPRSYSSRKEKMADPYKTAQKWNMTSSVRREYYGFKEPSNLNLWQINMVKQGSNTQRVRCLCKGVCDYAWSTRCLNKGVHLVLVKLCLLNCHESMLKTHRQMLLWKGLIVASKRAEFSYFIPQVRKSTLIKRRKDLGIFRICMFLPRLQFKHHRMRVRTGKLSL